MSLLSDPQLIQQRMEQAVTDALIRQSRYITPLTPSSQTKRTKMLVKTARKPQQLDIIRSVRNITQIALRRADAEIKQESIAKTLYSSPSPIWGRTKQSAVPPLTKEQANYLCKETTNYLYSINIAIRKKHRDALSNMKQGNCFYGDGGTQYYITTLAWLFIRFNVFPSLKLSDFDFFINNGRLELISIGTLLENPSVLKSDMERIALSEHYIKSMENEILELQKKNDPGAQDLIESTQKRINSEKKKTMNIFATLKSSYKFDKIAVIQLSTYFSKKDSGHAILAMINPFTKNYVILDSNGMEPLKNFQRSIINYLKNGFESIGYPQWEFKFYPRVRLQYEKRSCGMWSLWMGVVYLLGNYRECFYVKHRLDEHVNEFSKNIAAAMLYCLPMGRDVYLNELCELFTECDSSLFINWETLKAC